jgi:hypothetical protein
MHNVTTHEQLSKHFCQVISCAGLATTKFKTDSKILEDIAGRTHSLQRMFDPACPPLGAPFSQGYLGPYLADVEKVYLAIGSFSQRQIAEIELALNTFQVYLDALPDEPASDGQPVFFPM